MSDTKNNMSPSISNNSSLNRKHKLDKENFTIKIASASIAVKTDTECDNDKIFKRKKRFRSENHSNINEYNNKHQDYNNKDGFHRIKRQALNVDRDRSMNNTRLNQFSERPKLTSNNEKVNRSINILGSSEHNTKSNNSDDIDSNNKVGDENINTSNKSKGNSNGSFGNISKKKFNYNSEKSRFWSARNSSNSMHRNYNNKIHQGVVDSPSNELISNDDVENDDNNSSINSINSDNNNNNVLVNNSTRNGMSHYPNIEKKKHSFLNKHDNTISKNKKKPISVQAAAVVVNEADLPTNTKISIINSLNKEIKSKKIGIKAGHNQSTSSSTSSPSLHSKNTKTESDSDTNPSNSNNTPVIIPMDPTASIRSMVTSKEAGVIIGREGKNITKIREESTAKVTVSEHVPGSLDRIITVTGEIDTVVKAFFMMTKLIVVEFEKEKFGLTKISGSNVLNVITKDSIKDSSCSNNINNDTIDDESDKISNNSLKDIETMDDIKDDNFQYLDNTQNDDSYQIDSPQENEENGEENEDAQANSENLNHDDITKVLNIMNISNSNSDSEENLLINDNMNEDFDNVSTNNSIEDMELDNKKNTQEEEEEEEENNLKELFEQRTLTLRILIPDNRMGSIIGKGGSKIKEIQEKSKSTIVAAEEILPNSTEKVLKISGTVDAIRIAIHDVGNILRENPDRNLHTIYYKPMPLTFYKNTVPPPYPLPYSPSVIPPNFASPAPPYGCPIYINSPAPPPPAPPIAPALQISMAPFQPPPTITHSSLPQFNVNPQFTKNIHKSYNSNNSKINNTSISSNSNKKFNNINNTNTNNKNFNSNTNNKKINNASNKTSKFNSKPNTFIFKGNSNNRTKVDNHNSSSSLSTSTPTISNNSHNKSSYSKSNSNDSHSFSRSNSHYQTHGTFHHTKNSVKDRSKISGHSISYTTSPLVPQVPMDLVPNPTVLFQNADISMGPHYPINSFNMEVGIPNIVNSPQPILPSPRINDLRMMSPPLTPPPPSMSSSFHSNSNNSIISKSQSYGHRRNVKGNADVLFVQNFNGIPSGMSPLNPTNNNMNNGYSYMNPSKLNQSPLNSSFSHLNPIKSKLSKHPMKSSSPRTPVSSVQVKHLYISKEFVGCIIGKQGEIIKQIRNMSGSQIVIAMAHPNNTDRLITITGNKESNKIAENMILGRVENEKNKMMNQQLSPSQSPSSS